MSEKREKKERTCEHCGDSFTMTAVEIKEHAESCIKEKRNEY